MLRVGIVNNMSIGALASTEEQFNAILSKAGQDIDYEIVWYRMVGGARPASYRSMADLEADRPDALIITGAEPKTELLSSEAYWPSLCKTIDWARQRTQSTVFSCLASHAAAYHLDGIGRHRRNHKIFGLFESSKVGDHPLLEGIETSWFVPHSRWNDLSEDDLTKHGYTILARSRDAGVDMFAKQVDRSLFLFIQTHPEYASETLLREYFRDFARWQKSEIAQKPSIPRNYIDNDYAAQLEARPDGGVEELRNIVWGNRWNEVAICYYRNWLHLLTKG